MISLFLLQLGHQLGWRWLHANDSRWQKHVWHRQLCLVPYSMTVTCCRGVEHFTPGSWGRLSSGAPENIISHCLYSSFHSCHPDFPLGRLCWTLVLFFSHQSCAAATLLLSVMSPRHQNQWTVSAMHTEIFFPKNMNQNHHENKVTQWILNDSVSILTLYVMRCVDIMERSHCCYNNTYQSIEYMGKILHLSLVATGVQATAWN